MCRTFKEVSTMPVRKGQSKIKLTRLEKSRRAAKNRRDQEHEELSNLSKLLPVDQAILSRLDKSTVLRLAVCYLRLKKLTQTCVDLPKEKAPIKMPTDSASPEFIPEETVMTEVLREEEGRLMMEALNGFLILVGKNGRIIYVSEEVERHTGLKSVEMLGLSALEFIHTEDHADFMRQFSEVTDLDASSEDEEEAGGQQSQLQAVRQRHLYIRMKCRSDKAGQKIPQPGHLLTHWSGRLQLGRGPGDSEGGGDTDEQPGRVAVSRGPGGSEGDTDEQPARVAVSRGPGGSEGDTDEQPSRVAVSRGPGGSEGDTDEQPGRVAVSRVPGGSEGDTDEQPAQVAVLGLVAVVRPVQSEALVEINLDGNMFLSRHELSMKYIFCDPSILPLLGYEPDELIGRTAYEFHNPHDAKKIQQCHLNLIAKGTSVSKYYRFLSKWNGWVWMRTRGSIVYDADHEPQYVVCLNHVFSGDVGARFQGLEYGQADPADTNVQGYINVNSIAALSTPPTDSIESNKTSTTTTTNNGERSNNSASTISNGKNTLTKERGVDVEILKPGSKCDQDLGPQDSGQGKESSLPCSVSSAVSDHTYPVTTVCHSTTELPLGLRASGSSTFMDNLGLENLGHILDLGHGASWLESGPQTAMTSFDKPSERVINLTKTNSKDANRDCRIAVCSDHDYSAKPDSQAVHNQNHLNHSVTAFSDGSLDLLDGLDDVEMMDTDLLNSVSFGHTNYATDPGSVDEGDSLLNSLFGDNNKENMEGEKRDFSSSLLHAALNNGRSLQGPSRSDDLDRSRSPPCFPSDMNGDRDDAPLSSSDPFGMRDTDSLLGDQLKDMAARLSRSDPCMGVGSPPTLPKSTKTGSRNRGSKSKHLMKRASFDSVVTPPESPKLLARNERQLQPPQNTPSPSVPAYSPDSPPHSDRSSSGQPSPTSPTGSWALNHSWPNAAGSGSKRSLGSASHTHTGSSNHRRVINKRITSYQTTTHNPSQKYNKSHKSPKSDVKSNGSSLLEQFLLSKEPLNPNKGSDGLFKNSQVTEGISQLNLGQQLQTDANLLKQLLTGEIDDMRVHQYEESIIQTRRVTTGSDGTSPPTSPIMSYLVDDMDLDSGSLGGGEEQGELDLFKFTGGGDMNNLLDPVSPDVDILMQSDLDDILREQWRQEELWLQEYVS